MPEEITMDEKYGSSDGFQVDAWQVHPRLNRVRGPEGTVQLEPRVMQVLVCLGRRAGEVVSRQDLLHVVWQDAVVGDDALTRAIFDLRRIFGDSAQAPAVIETIRKVGYRLIAPVQPLPGGDGAKPVTAAGESVTQARLGRWRALHWLAAGLGLLVLGLAVLRLAIRPTPDDVLTNTVPTSTLPQAALRGTQLTSYRGFETFPALDPDGKRLAFAWEAKGREDTDLYLRAVEGENPLRLTDDPAAEDSPAWSPDGRSLAFFRSTDNEWGLYRITIPARDVQRLLTCQAPPLSPPAWSADGSAVLFADQPSPAVPYRIVQVDMASRALESLTTPPPGVLGDLYPAVAPDGQHLAFVRATAKSTVTTYLSPAVGDLFLLSLEANGRPADGARPRRLTTDNAQVPGLTWSADSTRLIFASNRHALGFALWQVAVEGGAPTLVVAEEGLLRNPSAAAKGGGLAYERWTGDTDILRVAAGSGLDSDDGLPRGTPLVASTRSDRNPGLSPDGSRLAFTSLRSGNAEIWVSDVDGAQPIRLTTFEPDPAETPRWSPDSRWLAFEVRRAGRSSLYIINADGGEPRQLTKGDFDDRAPSWSRDGRWLYFGSNRNGPWQIYRLPVAGGAVEQLSRNGGFAALEAPAARKASAASTDATAPLPEVYYTRRDVDGVWRLGGAGAQEVQVLPALSYEQWGNWTLAGRNLYYVELVDDGTTRFAALDLDNGHTHIVAAIDGWISRETPNLSVSADGRWILYAEFANLASDLRQLKGFR